MLKRLKLWWKTRGIGLVSVLRMQPHDVLVVTPSDDMPISPMECQRLIAMMKKFLPAGTEVVVTNRLSLSVLSPQKDESCDTQNCASPSNT